MARPVIALLTDFGLRDHYVAAMKGVVLGLCPDAAIVDITHDVPPQDILAGALELEAVAPYLPSGTIVVGVVDPGVGSARRGVIVETGGLRYVGPDNGLFSLVTRASGVGIACEIANPRFMRPSVSRTFEGRDRFAPAAGWLAAGTPIAEFGPHVSDLVSLDVPEPAVRDDGTLTGIVLRVDHFGNLVTNIPDAQVARFASVSIDVAGARIDRLAHTYADAAKGSLCALIGSTGRLEISVNGGSAADTLAASRGTAVHVRVKSGA